MKIQKAVYSKTLMKSLTWTIKKTNHSLHTNLPQLMMKTVSLTQRKLIKDLTPLISDKVKESLKSKDSELQLTLKKKIGIISKPRQLEESSKVREIWFRRRSITIKRTLITSGIIWIVRLTFNCKIIKLSKRRAIIRMIA